MQIPDAADDNIVLEIDSPYFSPIRKVISKDAINDFRLAFYYPVVYGLLFVQKSLTLLDLLQAERFTCMTQYI